MEKIIDMIDTEHTIEHSHVSQSRIERVGNMAHVYKPEGTYTLVYGDSHNYPQEIPVQFPSDLNGIFLETADNYLQDPLLAIKFYANRIPEYPKPQYEKVVRLAEERRLPLYLADADMVLDYPADLALLIGEISVAVGETAIGAAMLAKLAQTVKRRSMTRRDFLKWAGVTAGALWLSTPTISFLGRLGSGKTGVGEETTAEFQKTSHKLHPEQMLINVTIGNELLAYKEEWLMHNSGNRPHTATFISTEHTQIEDAILSSSTDRLAFLQSVKPVIKALFNPETVYKMVKLDYNVNKWQVGETFEIPELKALLD